MSCGPAPTTFRVLGADASWELDLAPDSAVTIGDAIELQRIDPAAADPTAPGTELHA